MTAIEGFTQREPRNGQPASERTNAYLARDAENLYAIFICFDAEPARVRGHLTRREDLTDEDTVTLYLDTFHDGQRAYAFTVNPAGVQQDAIWTENGGLDTTFDTVWKSEGKRTTNGYVVWIAIPFKSIRFPAHTDGWGIVLQRTIARKREDAFWPFISNEKAGRLTQEALLTGLTEVIPGRNIQLTPYSIARSFREIDLLAPSGASFRRADFATRTGADSKFIVHNSLVVDTTLNPDFSQVESDEPQASAKERFEIYFPEKRPFFLENSDYFQTAFADNSSDFFHLTSPLLFTRRIQDPNAGVRITGKIASNLVGVLVADDRGPGETVPTGNPLFRRRAHYAVLRVARDVGGSRVGAMFLRRDLAGQSNRIAGVDARLRFGDKWVGLFRSTMSSDSTLGRGHTIDAEVVRDDNHVHFDLAYYEASPNYVQRAGFYRRPDIRRLMQFAGYRFRRDGQWLAWWMPLTYDFISRDFAGHPLDRNFGVEIDAKLGGATVVDIYRGRTDETLRPSDYAALTRSQTFSQYWTGGDITTQLSRTVSGSLSFYRQGKVNYNPPAGVAPFQTGDKFAKAVLRLRPTTALSIDTSWVVDRLANPGNERVFTNQIFRTKWNYQFNRNLSVRLIGQYASLLPNPALTAFQTTKDFNGDFLIAYMVSPGTAFYFGYNGNLQNYDRSLRFGPDGDIARTERGMINDSRQVFAKVSYQIRL